MLLLEKSMENKVPTEEYLNSSDYDKLLFQPQNYTLGIGYCYVKQLYDLGLFQAAGIPYYFFQTKYGWCGTNFLFSALKPKDILILSAWGNSAATTPTTEVPFRIWKSILDNLILLDVPILMIDMPAAFHLCTTGGKLISQDFVKQRRLEYKKKVLSDLKKVEYVDLFDFVPNSWGMILENEHQNPAEFPWHLRNELLAYIFPYVLDFKQSKFDKDRFVSGLTQLSNF